ncbi:hypothetical protein, partial [Salmonella enterica]|uniref:hypothetical protein n=1 Tax=Salmonella enterica TaxID=28901 RepID=UPI00391EF2A0
PGQVDTSHREGGTRGGDHSSSSSEGDQQRHSGNDGHYGIGGGDTQHGDQHGTYRPGGTSRLRALGTGRAGPLAIATRSR